VSWPTRLSLPLEADNRRDIIVHEFADALEGGRAGAHPGESQGDEVGALGTAARLGMNRSTLQFRMKELGILRPAM